MQAEVISPSGIAIDHSRDEWGNKLTSYPNDTGANITVQVSLDVYDINGLKSLKSATCDIIVKPDLPPIAKLDVPALSIRGVKVDILNKSTSSDGDLLITSEYKYKYDANNNGFADDTWVAITGTMTKISLTPTKVGKYYFYVKVTEQYGMWDDTLSDSAASLTLNVVNNAPEVSFDMEGKNPQPDLTPKTTVSAAKMSLTGSSMKRTAPFPLRIENNYGLFNQERLQLDRERLSTPSSNTLRKSEMTRRTGTTIIGLFLKIKGMVQMGCHRGEQFLVRYQSENLGYLQQ